jgi:molybdopterin-synthase adenylyltransferase
MSQDRYLRHSLIDWFDQDLIKKASVLVVGAGAVGNEVLKNLALLGIGKIHIIDFDRIEIHNLTRSVLFKEADVGKFKAQVAAEAITHINSDIKVEYTTLNFWGYMSISKIKNYDAVFCCVDNYEARLKLNRLCLLASVDFFNSGIDSRFVSVEKYPFRSQPQTSCYECGFPESAYTHIRERYSCGWLKKRAYEERKIPTTTITSSIAGSLMCSMYLQIKHKNSPPGSVKIYFDSVTGSSSTVYLPNNDDCFSCNILNTTSKQAKIARKSILSHCLDFGLKNNDLIWLSDQIILKVQCSVCRKTQIINDVADKYDDSLTFCSSCNLASNVVEIRDSLTFDELRNFLMFKTFPVNFIWFDINNEKYLIELEGN